MNTLPAGNAVPDGRVPKVALPGLSGEMIQLSLDTPNPASDSPITVSQAVTTYLALRIEEGMVEKSDTYRHTRKHLQDRLRAVIGSWPISHVTTDHLREWGRQLVRDDDGKPMSDLTRRHHLVSVKTFFKRAWMERWIQSDPSKALVLPAIDEGERAVMPVRDVFRFFKANRDATCIGRIALEAFGGLRFTSAGRITEEYLKFARKGIELPGKDHKTGKRKFRQGQPANLWEWLNHAPKACWDITLRQYADDKKDMMVMAGIRPIRLRTAEDRAKTAKMKNIWRHSFASYLLARTKDFGPVAYQMQHSTPKTTEIYEGKADELDAVMYFAITPQTVLLSWEEFSQKVSAIFEASLSPSVVPLISIPETPRPQ